MLRSDYNVNEVKARNLASDQLFSDIPINFIEHPQSKDIRPITDIAAVRQSLKILVLSNWSERPFHPELGGNVTQYLFEPATTTTAIAMRDEILRVIERNEPRVKNVDVSITHDIDRNALYVTINFQMKNDQPGEVNFYLERIR
jgi:phage baseplate assembly protein W